jgi:probable F420-dependent oxidoreductase
MKFGVVYPQTEYSSDPAAVRDYAQLVENLGYSHILAYDHVLGANPDRPGWSGPYTYKTPFIEPFILFSFMAGITQTIEFTTGVIILPQRQTALVAKQTATLDVLSHGRLRLGFGIGWNEVEYIGLNENFHNRGRRIEEQIAVLKSLWKDPLVTYRGKWHNIPDAGINPIPKGGYIPIWMGGHSEIVLKRTARLCDGWMPNYKRVAEAQRSLDILFTALEDEGRVREDFGIEVRLDYQDGNPDRWAQTIQDWQTGMATHFSINTMGCGFTEPDQHLKAIEKFARSVKLYRPN